MVYEAKIINVLIYNQTKYKVIKGDSVTTNYFWIVIKSLIPIWDLKVFYNFNSGFGSFSRPWAKARFLYTSLSPAIGNLSKV